MSGNSTHPTCSLGATSVHSLCRNSRQLSPYELSGGLSDGPPSPQAGGMSHAETRDFHNLEWDVTSARRRLSKCQAVESQGTALWHTEDLDDASTKVTASGGTHWPSRTVHRMTVQLYFNLKEEKKTATTKPLATAMRCLIDSVYCLCGPPSIFHHPWDRKTHPEMALHTLVH